MPLWVSGTGRITLTHLLQFTEQENETLEARILGVMWRNPSIRQLVCGERPTDDLQRRRLYETARWAPSSARVYERGTSTRSRWEAARERTSRLPKHTRQV